VSRTIAPRACTALAVLRVWTALVVLLAAGVGYLWVEKSRTDALDRARLDALAAARSGVVPLLSYTGSSIEADLATSRRLLTGDFRDEYTTLVQRVVAPAARRDGIVTRAEVAAASVVSAERRRVVTLLFVTQTTQSKALKEQRLDGSRLRVTLSEVDGRWLISDLAPV
jgi:Mce-associated membrane protein